MAGTGSTGNADGSALNATFDTPTGLGLNASGDTLYISETSPTGGGRLRQIKFSDPTVPAVSEWGMITMTLLALTVGTGIFRKRRLSTTI